jgi:hypothetical protein
MSNVHPFITNLKNTEMIERKNEFENRTIQLIQSIVPIQACYPEGNSVDVLKIMKSTDRSNKVFLDACSPYHTPLGNNKKTEIVLHCPAYGINWRLECKSLKKYSSMVGATLYELNFIAKIHEDKYCLLLEGALTTPYVTRQICQIIREKNLRDKVWYGSLQEFEQLLRFKMSA